MATADYEVSRYWKGSPLKVRVCVGGGEYIIAHRPFDCSMVAKSMIIL